MYLKNIFSKHVPSNKAVNHYTNHNIFNTRGTKIIFSNIRHYSSKSNNNNINYDSDKDKLILLDVCKNKSGIYMWTNKLNNKKYIGSSVNLKRRLLEYYNVNRLLNEKSMSINKALLKYGYSNFTIKILEFCDTNSLTTKEKYYFDMFSPEYNILNTPASPSRGSGWFHSEATKEKMKIAALERFSFSASIIKCSLAQSSGTKIMVTDLETKMNQEYSSIKGAARDLKIDSRYIQHYIYLSQDKPVLGKYTFKLVNNENKNRKTVVQKTSQKIQVINVETNETTEHLSISAAARAIGVRQPSISLYVKENRSKPFKGKYIFKLLS